MCLARWLCPLAAVVLSAGMAGGQPLIDGVVDDRIDYRADASTFKDPTAAGIVWGSPLIYHQDAAFLRLRFTDIRDDRATPLHRAPRRLGPNATHPDA